jgi:SOS response regulatory protein OraA/RecX
MAKGVKKEDIENAYSDVDVDSKSNAKAVAEKYLKNKETTKENMAKAYRYLIGRGFSYEDATFALSFFNGED